MAKKLATDKGLFTAIVVLLGFGLVMVYSASDVRPIDTDAPVVQLTPLIKQLVAMSLGFVAMLALLSIDYRVLRKPWVVYSMMAGVLALLVAVLFSPLLNSSHRWIFLGGFSLQPSELAKVGLVVYLAYQFDRKRGGINGRSLLLPCGLALFMVSLLILVEPDLGTTILVVAIAGVMFFLAGLAWRYVLLGSAVVLPALLTLALLWPSKWQRLLIFLDPEADPMGDGWQIGQSLMAVGSGGVTGVGLGESVQKLAYLPMANSDFIFAVVCEELGFIGGVGLLAVFALFAWRGFVAGRDAPDTFGRYLAWGLTAALTLQALLHMSISLSLAPTTGMTLPFISYGGTSLIVTLACCGLLLNVSQHA